MSISAIGSLTNAPPVQPTQAVAPTNTRAADGDYKTAGAGTSSVRDSDGDYKPATTAQTVSNAVLSALTQLQTGSK